MRAYFTILVAALALLASSGVASAASVSSPANAEQTAIHYVENEANSGRFLRKRLEDESEERVMLVDAAKKVKQYVNGEQKLAKLFKKSDEQLLKKSIHSDFLTKGVERLEKAGWPAATIEKFKAVAERYSSFRTAKALQNYKLNFEHV